MKICIRTLLVQIHQIYGSHMTRSYSASPSVTTPTLGLSQSAGSLDGRRSEAGECIIQPFGRLLSSIPKEMTWEDEKA